MPSREYVDPGGTRWEVFEVRRLDGRPDSVRPALASGWLAFVSATEKRRLPRYPAHWLELGDDELHELLHGALVAPEPIYRVIPGGTNALVGVQGDPVTRAERRARPRVVRPSSTAAPTTTPAAPPPTPPPARNGLLAAGDIDALVREQARLARRTGVAVIEGMHGVKRALAEAGEEVSPELLRQLRKVFVDEFYFVR